MLGNIGFPTLVLIVILALLLFGPNKLPELGRAFGKTLREFKNGAKELMDDEADNQRTTRKEVNAEQPVIQSDSGKGKERDERRLPD